MQDPRLRERRSVHVLGIAVCGALALICIHHFLSGVVTGEVPCIPFKGRSCRAGLLDYSRAEHPVRYAAGLVFWLGFGVFQVASVHYIWRRLVWAGGLFGTPDERLARRIALHRRRLDRAICARLVAAIPPHWTSARLELVWEMRQGAAHLRHVLSGPDGRGDTALPGELHRATDELFYTLQKLGGEFRRSVYSVTRRPGGGWERAISVE